MLAQAVPLFLQLLYLWHFLIEFLLESIQLFLLEHPLTVGKAALNRDELPLLDPVIIFLVGQQGNPILFGDADDCLLVIVQVEPVPALDQLIEMGFAWVGYLAPIAAVGVRVFFVRPWHLEH